MSSAAWPPTNTRPTPESPWYCDGKLERGQILQVTPLGVVYGQMHRVAADTHKLWWTGSGYKYVATVDEVMSPEELPPGPRPFGEMWAVRTYDKAKNSYYWAEWWWDAEVGQWKALTWLWTIDGFADLPDPGLQVGAAHVVLERDILYFFDGEQFRRPPHSSLDDDEPLRHLPNGFLRTLQPDARVVYYSPSEIGLEAIKGGSGKVLVNLEYVAARRDASVFANLAVLQWHEDTSTIQAAYIESDTEYWIYLANSSTAFVSNALPGDGSHAAAPAWDYRGRLFLSLTPDHNGYLGATGAGRDARLVGKIQTDSTPPSEGGPFFLREIDISLISRQVSLPETYREFSDFVVQFVDQDTLALTKIDGTYGQIYAGGNLHYLGTGYELSRSDAWIEWDDMDGTRVIRHTEALSSSSHYYLYVAGEVDPYNFNEINPETNRPWQATDTGAAGHYVAALDMRLTVFLSPQHPDHGFLSEAWPGYYARHIGQVKTDANGRFVNSWDLSAIRQPTLNPSWFDGLAEIEITPVNSSEVRVCRKKGSSGIVNVRGAVVQTYPYDSADVHEFHTTDVVQLYTESNLTEPLSDLDAVSSYADTELHLYLANARELWGDHVHNLFFSTTAPSGGYLSQNWPGNNARWICTVKPDAEGLFTGAFITGTISISAHSQLFDDEPEKHRLHNDTQVTNLNLLSAAAVLFEIQKVQGLPVRLTRVDGTHIKLAPIGDQEATVILPDINTKVVPAAGITADVVGLLGNTYYVYLTPSGVEVSLTAPDKTYANLQTHGSDHVLVGWYSLGAPLTLSGDWNLWSFSHEVNREFSTNVTATTTTLSLPGCIVPPGRYAALTRTGQDCASGWGGYDSNIGGFWSMQGSVGTGSASFHTALTSGLTGQATLVATATLSNADVAAGIYSAFTLTHSLSWTGFTYVASNYSQWDSFSGKLIFARQ
jgi:hypothetical protein